MRILITFHDINNPGGLVGSHEDLYFGLKELGHEVDIALLRWQERIFKRARSEKVRNRESVGIEGWEFWMPLAANWPSAKQFPYKGKENLARWKEYASKFDLIIWQVPVPNKKRENKGNLDWLELYNVPTKQVVCIHDGNFQKRYPWLYAVSQHLTAAIGVHHCAYNSLSKLAAPRSLIFHAHFNMEERMSDLSEKRSGWMSLQVFKSWKRVDQLIRAVPFMETERKLLAGGGMHYYYMTSPDKTKDRYYWQEGDGGEPEFLGRRIWETAIEAGMQYLGWIHTDERDKLLKEVRCLVDPTWAPNALEAGTPLNRTIVEAYILGAVPVARNLGMADNVAGISDLFKPDENYIMIPHDASPREFAKGVDEACNLSRFERRRLIANGRKLLVNFDAKVVAQQFVDLALGKPTGFYNKLPADDPGVYDAELEASGKKVLETFFADEEPKSQVGYKATRRRVLWRESQ